MKTSNFGIIILLAFSMFFFVKCRVDEGEKPYNGEGYKPVYLSSTEAFDITSSSATTISTPGKMYLLNDIIYLVDKGRGVHIINNVNPSNPQKVKFISIPGVKDVVVKGGILYADNITDLVAIDISNLSNITVKKRFKDIYAIEDTYYPEGSAGYFECVDPSKGYVVRWEKTTLTDAKCFR